MIGFRLLTNKILCAMALGVPLAACSPEPTGPTGERAAALTPARATAVPLLSDLANLASQAPAARGADRPRDDLFDLARGRWLGQCELLLPGRDEPATTFEIERITEATDVPGDFTWTIIYRAPGVEQVRPYTMRVDPQSPGRYLLDENNGIVLTNYLHDGGLLVSAFAIDGLHLSTRETFRGGRYDFEITVTATTPELSSSVEGFVVDAFAVSSIQKCRLQRQSPKDR
ncbi:MAG: hypothetical protein MUF34_34375 [Polyangiaceae bacterium]|jgi:hypothetical protein|nr:hypothetical protein [Polyangiaceae bacterium]